MSDTLKELAGRVERGENTFALEQDIGNYFADLYPERPTVWPAYCNSLDAVAALAERVLPGWGFYLRKDTDGCGCGMVYPEANRVTPCHVTTPTPATALLAALLRAKAAP